MRSSLLTVVLTLLLVHFSSSLVQLGKIQAGVGKDLDGITLESNNPLKKGLKLNGIFTGTRVVSVVDGGKALDVLFQNKSKAEIIQVKDDSHLSHYVLTWTNLTSQLNLQIDYDDVNQVWFTAYEESIQRWPRNISSKIEQQTFTAKVYSGEIEAVIEPFWLSSSGFAIYVERSSPLLIHQENKKLSLSADYHFGPYNVSGVETQLVVNLISGENVLTTFKYVKDKWFKKPEGIPDKRMMEQPVW